MQNLVAVYTWNKCNCQDFHFIVHSLGDFLAENLFLPEMYNNNYTRPKVALKAQDIRRSKGKGCGYYLRIIFFFSSLIQSLIIVSLVLFLVYGQPEKSADEKRVEELQQSFNKLSSDNTNLRKEKANLTLLLKVKTTEKDAEVKKVVKFTAELDAAKANNTRLLQLLVSLHSFWFIV